jgi:hypothetical protein
VNKLKTVATFLDPFVLYRHEYNATDGPTAVLVDDSLFTGTENFAEAETEMHQQFDKGSTSILTRNNSVNFGGVNIIQTEEHLCLCQQYYIDHIGLVNKSDTSITTIRKGRGKPAWVATWTTRPEIAYHVGQINQVTEETASAETVKMLNKITKYLKKTGSVSLKFPTLDKDSIYLAAYGDASFAGNADIFSQMGGVMALCDSTDNCHLLHWFSKKCSRVTSSILAAEVIACVTVYDIANSLEEVLQKILARRVDMYLFADYYSLFSTTTKYQSLCEKRLLIDIAVLRQAHRHHEVDNVGFTRSSHNLADCLSKDVQNSALLDMLHTG